MGGMHNMFKKTEWAKPLVYMSLNQQIITSAVGSSAFFIIAPVAGGFIGTYVGCTSLGCGLGSAFGMSSTTGLISGGGTAAITGGLTNYFVKSNTRKWLKNNSGKKFINSMGKVEIIRGLAFISISTLGSSPPRIVNSMVEVIGNIPTWFIPTVYAFTINYVATRRRIRNQHY